MSQQHNDPSVSYDLLQNNAVPLCSYNIKRVEKLYGKPNSLKKFVLHESDIVKPNINKDFGEGKSEVKKESEEGL